MTIDFKIGYFHLHFIILKMIQKMKLYLIKYVKLIKIIKKIISKSIIIVKNIIIPVQVINHLNT